jgi:uncharacterized protein (TIGR01777 family)
MTENNGHRVSTVLITGGTGLIGRHLASLLLRNGYNVSVLSRNETYYEKVKSFKWDPEKQTITSVAVDGVDYVVHLAGANLGEKRWTRSRKEEIIKSRTASAKLLYGVIKDKGIRLKAFISASGISYYGTETTEKIFTEDDPPGNDFLSEVCSQWEEAASLFEALGVRTVRIRTAIVLEKTDSALASMMKPAKFGFLAQTGSGKQYMPWIHISDLCNIYLKALEDASMTGVYNAAAPNHATHSDFIKTLGGVMKKPVFPIPVPEFILKIIFGEMSELVLRGSRISSEKITDAGYKFRYADLKEALEDIIR